MGGALGRSDLFVLVPSLEFYFHGAILRLGRRLEKCRSGKPYCRIHTPTFGIWRIVPPLIVMMAFSCVVVVFLDCLHASVMHHRHPLRLPYRSVRFREWSNPRAAVVMMMYQHGCRPGTCKEATTGWIHRTTTIVQEDSYRLKRIELLRWSVVRS